MARAKSGQTGYIMKVTLNGSRPAIWRRFCVPGEISLDRLHDVIQIVMGWQEMHLHCFEIGGQRYTEAPEDAEVEGAEEAGFKLCDLVRREGAKFSYEYDFGDDWHHTLAMERIEAVPKDAHACIACMGGRRSCPPEDVGGIDGYGEFLAAMKDRKHREHEEFVTWCGGGFDANAFDLGAVNLELAKYARWSRPRAISQELMVPGLSGR